MRRAKSLRDASKLYNCEGMSSDFSSVCSSNLNKNSQDIDYSNNAYKVATDRNSQIQDLMGQINSTNDPKSIAELQARIAGENVSVANEANRIAIWKEMSAANERANQQKVAEWYVSALKRDSALSGTVYTP
jgi:type IV secretion system protein VirB5